MMAERCKKYALRKKDIFIVLVLSKPGFKQGLDHIVLHRSLNHRLQK